MSQVAQATCSSEPYIGSICFTAASFCPGDYYIEADGRELSMQQYSTLYTVIGIAYGGNGRTTVGIPDLRGRSPVGQGQGPGLEYVAQGLPQASSLRGAETISQVPLHTHTASFSPAPGSAGATIVKVTTKSGVDSVPSAINNQLSAAFGPAAKIYGPAASASDTQIPLAGVSGGSAGPITVTSTGNSTVNIIPPQTALRACIAVRGLYPTRP